MFSTREAGGMSRSRRSRGFRIRDCPFFDPADHSFSALEWLGYRVLEFGLRHRVNGTWQFASFPVLPPNNHDLTGDLHFLQHNQGRYCKLQARRDRKNVHYMLFALFLSLTLSHLKTLIPRRRTPLQRTFPHHPEMHAVLYYTVSGMTLTADGSGQTMRRNFTNFRMITCLISCPPQRRSPSLLA